MTDFNNPYDEDFMDPYRHYGSAPYQPTSFGYPSQPEFGGYQVMPATCPFMPVYGGFPGMQGGYPLQPGFGGYPGFSGLGETRDTPDDSRVFFGRRPFFFGGSPFGFGGVPFGLGFGFGAPFGAFPFFII